MSVRDFAAHLGNSDRAVSKWEARGRDVHPWPVWQAALDTALAQASDDAKARFELLVQADSVLHEERQVIAPPRSAGLLTLNGDRWDGHSTAALAEFLADNHDLTPDTAQRLSHEWRVVDPPQVVEMKAGRRVGERLAKVVIERADALRHMDDFLGGGDMHDLVRRELQVTLDTVRDASYTEKTGRLLLASVGELAQLAGWVASDAGLHAKAERYYLGGVAAAHAAEDEPLAGHLLSSLAYQIANVGDPREAVLLASTAYRGAEPTATPTEKAILLERVAWANARFGDAKATEAALDQVDEAFADSNPANDPGWTYWLNREEIDVMTGRCWTQLKRPERAIELLTQSCKRYDDTHARELALYLTWLAEAHIYAEKIEEAAANATRALRLSAGVTSARSSERLKLVRGLLVPYRDNTAVEEFAEEAREALKQPGAGCPAPRRAPRPGPAPRPGHG
jgi:tetratricopeptide (TPR) repeat protein